MNFKFTLITFRLDNDGLFITHQRLFDARTCASVQLEGEKRD